MTIIARRSPKPQNPLNTEILKINIIYILKLKMSKAKLGDDDDKDRIFDYKALESKIYPKRGSLD